MLTPRDPRVEMAKVMVQIKSRLQQNLRQQNRNATSKLSKTLEILVDQSNIDLNGYIKGNHYWKYIDSGRGPGGSFKTIKAAILDWMDVRGIRPNNPDMTQDELASIFTAKIIQKGYKGNLVFTEVIENVKRDTKLFIPISEAFVVSSLNIFDNENKQWL